MVRECKRSGEPQQRMDTERGRQRQKQREREEVLTVRLVCFGINE